VPNRCHHRGGVQSRGSFAHCSIPAGLWITAPVAWRRRRQCRQLLGGGHQRPWCQPSLVRVALQENMGIPLHACARVHLRAMGCIIDALAALVSPRTVPHQWTDCGDEGCGTARRARGTSTAGHPWRMPAIVPRLTTSTARRQRQALLPTHDAALGAAALRTIARVAVGVDWRAESCPRSTSAGHVLSHQAHGLAGPVAGAPTGAHAVILCV